MIIDDSWVLTERSKYERVWTHEFYREQADGDLVLDVAYERMGCAPGESLIDWGCGCGRPAQKFQHRGLKVTGVDIAFNCLDKNITIPLIVGCIWDRQLPPLLKADYAFCTDVLEHIPPNKLDEAIVNIADRTIKAAYIQVCTLPDTAGVKLDPPAALHLSVLDADEWYMLLLHYWKSVELEHRGKSRASFLCRPYEGVEL